MGIRVLFRDWNPIVAYGEAVLRARGLHFPTPTSPFSSIELYTTMKLAHKGLRKRNVEILARVEIRTLAIPIDRIIVLHKELEQLFKKVKGKFVSFVERNFDLDEDVNVYPSFSLVNRGGGYLGSFVTVDYNPSDTSAELYLKILTHELFHFVVDKSSFEFPDVDEEMLVEALNTLFWHGKVTARDKISEAARTLLELGIKP